MKAHASRANCHIIPKPSSAVKASDSVFISGSDKRTILVTHWVLFLILGSSKINEPL